MIYSVELNSQNFEHFINNEAVSIVMVKASWCGPCKNFTPIIEEFAQEGGNNLILGKMDVDSNLEFVKSLDVRTIPTLLVYKNGIFLEKVVGSKSKSELTEIVERSQFV